MEHIVDVSEQLTRAAIARAERYGLLLGFSCGSRAVAFNFLS
jgi:hypothetical protein